MAADKLPIRHAFLVMIFLSAIAAPAIQSALGATWYVRPASGEYGAEDGSSYASAFDGFAGLAWGSIGDGDTIIVCGKHWEKLTNRKSDITLDLRCIADSDPATLYGSRQITSGWSGPDANGEYTIMHKPVEGSRFYGPVVRDGDILDSEGTPGSLAAGQWGWSLNTLYVKDDPAGSSFEVGDRWQCISQGDYGIKGLTILGGTLKYPHKHGVGLANTAPANNYGGLVINGTVFIGPQEQAVNTFHSSGPPGKTWEEVTVTNCIITDAGGEAIYLKSIKTAATVTNNEIGGAKVGWSGNGGTSDFRGDGIQVGEPGASFDATIRNNTIWKIDGAPIRYIGTNATISQNRIFDCGCDAYGTQPAQDNYCMSITPESIAGEGDAIMIERNLIEYSADSAHGIRLSRGSSYSSPPITIQNNIILMGGEANQYDGIHHFKSEQVSIYHNTVIGPRYAYRIYSDNNAITGAVKNNIFQARFPIHCSENEISNLAVENNLFHGQGSEANAFYVNGNYASVAAMDAAVGSFANNIEGDPLLSLYAPARGSPAVDAGAGGLGITADHYGSPRPLGGGFDIGAIEKAFCLHDPDDSGATELDELMQVIALWRSGSRTLRELIGVIEDWKNGCGIG